MYCKMLDYTDTYFRYSDLALKIEAFQNILKFL
jgi:hypothetical protein